MASISRDVHFQTGLTIKSTQQISKYISLLEEMDKLNFSIVISIADESVGIPEEELEDVFDSFVQSSKTKNQLVERVLIFQYLEK
jgi:signal transduction histidine kinase